LRRSGLCHRIWSGHRLVHGLGICLRLGHLPRGWEPASLLLALPVFSLATRIRSSLRREFRASVRRDEGPRQDGRTRAIDIHAQAPRPP
jgi:hypothetical protein